MLLQFSNGIKTVVEFYHLIPMEADESGEGHFNVVMDTINNDGLYTVFKKKLVAIGELSEKSISIEPELYKGTHNSIVVSDGASTMIGMCTIFISLGQMLKYCI